MPVPAGSLDQGWSEFHRQPKYKMFWKGGVLLAVAARNTSRTCPRSGHVAQENHKTQAKFERVEFGTRTTPMSSAQSIFRAGHRLFA
jgi:putative transposase